MIAYVMNECMDSFFWHIFFLNDVWDETDFVGMWKDSKLEICGSSDEMKWKDTLGKQQDISGYLSGWQRVIINTWKKEIKLEKASSDIQEWHWMRRATLWKRKSEASRRTLDVGWDQIWSYIRVVQERRWTEKKHDIQYWLWMKGKLNV